MSVKDKIGMFSKVELPSPSSDPLPRSRPKSSTISFSSPPPPTKSLPSTPTTPTTPTFPPPSVSPGVKVLPTLPPPKPLPRPVSATLSSPSIHSTPPPLSRPVSTAFYSSPSLPPPPTPPPSTFSVTISSPSSHAPAFTSPPTTPTTRPPSKPSTPQDRAAMIAENERQLAALREAILLQQKEKQQQQELAKLKQQVEMKKNEEMLAMLRLQVLQAQQEKEKEKLLRMVEMQRKKEILQNLIEAKVQLQLKEEIVQKKRMLAKKQADEDRIKEQVRLNELRHKLKMKEMEQEIKRKELDLKEQQIAMASESTKGQAEAEKVKARIRYTQLLEKQLDFKKAILEAENVVLDTRHPDTQYGNSSAWPAVASPQRRAYAYSHDELKLTYNSSKPTSLRVNPAPFAKGSVRFAYFAMLGTERVVVKKFLYSQGFDEDLREAEEMVKTHSAAEHFAHKYNSSRPASTPCMEVCHTYLVLSGQTVWMVEPSLPGEYKKWNNNDEFVDNTAHAPNALTHFSWVESKGAMLLVDLQGVEQSNKFMLTDPAFHTSASTGFGDLNRGKMGFEAFFVRHICSHICSKMSLSKHPCQK